jgi:NADPH:quinone reductase-like Zn-dependent oxidoreductase
VAIQLAKARGLHVTTTCSARNINFVESLGADVAVDYNAARFEDQPAFDGVIDVIGGAYETRSLAALGTGRGKAFVSVMNSGALEQAKGSAARAGALTLWRLATGKLKAALRLGPSYTIILVKPSGAQLAEVAALVDAGKVRPEIEMELPLERAAEAHAHVEGGHARGKVVLLVDEALAHTAPPTAPAPAAAAAATS